MRPDEIRNIQRMIDSSLESVHSALPGKVVSFSEEKQTSTIRVTVFQPFNSGASAYPELEDVKVFMPFAGGYSLTLPVAAGDACLVLFSERDLQAWMTRAAEGLPESKRRFSLSDGLAIVGFPPDTAPISSYAMDGLEIRNSDRTDRITVRDSGQVEIVSKNEVLINCQVATVTAAVSSACTAPVVTVNASTSSSCNSPLITLNGAVTNVTGALNVTGLTTLTGGVVIGGTATGLGGAPITIDAPIASSEAISTTADVTAGSTSLAGHQHNETGDGGGTTTPPI